MKNRENIFYRNDIFCTLENKINTGNLSITVKNRENNEPITFAEVSIFFLNIRGLYSESGEAFLLVRHVTDKNGKVPLIELPIIDKRAYPLSQYFITVNHFRFHPVNLFNIEIFPNVITEYNILLAPLTSVNPDYEYIITPIRQ